MIVICDTREQSPLEFTHPYITEIRREALPVGDYTVIFENGYQPKVFFERKSIGALSFSLGEGHKRFKRMLQRAIDRQDRIIIIVEGTLTKVLGNSKYSSVSGETIVKMMFTMEERYGISFVFSKDREEMALYITHKFMALGREHLKCPNSEVTQATNSSTRNS